MSDVTPDHYLLDTTSTVRAPGIRELTLTDRWNTPTGRPNGGYILATMLRAATLELACEHDPIYANITYLSAPELSPATIHISELKRGRSLQTVRVVLEQQDRVVAQLTAGFGPRGEGMTLELGSPPNLSRPDECIDPRGIGLPEGGIFDRTDWRLSEIPGWALGKPSSRTDFQMWQRLAGGREIDAIALAFLADSAPPTVLELGASGSLTVNLTVHFHRRPAPGWIATSITTNHVIGGYHDEDCELWDENGQLVAHSRQVAILT